MTSDRESDLPVEPLILVLGKQFHEDFRSAYLAAWPGPRRPTSEARVRRSRGTARWDSDGSLSSPVVLRPDGRADILIEYEDSDGLVASVVVEIKNTAWDRVEPHRVRPNLAKQRRQIWGYLEPLLIRADAGEVGGPQAFVVYPRRPQRAGLAEEVESFMSDDYGIVVVYADELLADVP